MRLALINGFNYYAQSYDFARSLEKSRVQVVVFTYNSCEVDDLMAKGIDACLIQGKLSVSRQDYILNCESVYYGLPNWLINLRTDGLSSWFESQFIDRGIDGIFQQPGGELHRMVASMVAKRLGIKEIILGERYISGKTVLYRDLFKSSIWELPSHEKTNVNLNALLEKKQIVHKRTVFTNWQSPKWIRFFKHFARMEWLVIYVSFAHKIKLAYKKSMSRLFIGPSVLKGSKKPVIYFNLNVPAESELYIRNPDFTDQISTIKTVLISLPGSHVYVKFHPSPEGFIGFLDTIKLLLMRDVTLLKRSFYSTDIIKNVQTVAAVSGSVIIEAIIQGKNVFILGYWYYEKILSECADSTRLSNGVMYSNINRKKFFERIASVACQGSVNQDLVELDIFSGSICDILNG